MHANNQGVVLAALLACALGAGCSTPQPARDLASQGALTVELADTEVRAFIDRATQSYKRREAIVQRLAKGEITDVGNADFNAWVAGEAGLASDHAKALQIKKIAEQSRTSRERIQADLDKKAKAISGAFGEPVAAPVKNLAEAKKAFLLLAQELTPKEWLEFSWKYAKQVQADLKAIEGKSGESDPPK